MKMNRKAAVLWCSLNVVYNTRDWYLAAIHTLIEVKSNRIAEYLNKNSNNRRYPVLLQLFPVITGTYTAIFGKILDISPVDKHNPCSTKTAPPHFGILVN